MSAKQLLNGDDARHKIFKGVEKLANAVAATMGPSGRNVLIDKKYGGPTVTKDGVTVAKEIELEDPYENMGAQLVKEAATKTNDAAGDGTTTATVLARALMEAGLRHLKKGSNAIGIKRGIMMSVEAVTKHLETQAKPVSKREERAAVATISAQDKEIGETIADIFEKVGNEGVVTVDKSETLGIEMEIVEGMQFDQGYISAYFATDMARMEATFQKAAILITDAKISSIQQILPIIESLAQKGKKDLVIIAESVDGEALATLVLNKLQGRFNSLAVKAPAFGDRRKEILKDIAALTGGRLISEEVGLKLENATAEDLGLAGKVIVTKDTTTIVDGNGDKKEIAARVEQIKAAMDQTKSDFDREKLAERLGKLTGGVAIIKVGAATEVEQKEKQHRVEDALSATRAAGQEGIVAGGGTAYIRALESLDGLKTKNADEQIGIAIVREALTAPLKHIAANAGVVGDVVVDKVQNELKDTHGYNA
ncbi:MAG: chaperonin GroEL, partial [Candidatus Peribacteraceae bacterium]|nr:chaperonin GroEL [Candidatus Peribacteraceae bacterium]